jgi:predicted nucleic acid-binding protein
VIYLLDVNMLIAAIWQDHEDQRMVEAWLRGKQTATCPISELGFLRISPERFRGRFIPDDFSPRTLAARSSRQFTDLYLAELAEKHRMKLATLDTRISHRAVELVP